MKNNWNAKNKDLKEPKTYGLPPTIIKYVKKNFEKRGFRSESAMVQWLIEQDRAHQAIEKAAKRQGLAVVSNG